MSEERNKLLANWINNNLSAKMTEWGLDFDACPIPPHHIGELVDLILDGTISSKIAKDVFERMCAFEGSPREIVEKHGLQQLDDSAAIEQAVDDLIAANPDKAEQVKAKPQAVGWFVGQIMKSTGGKANPETVGNILRSKLGV